MSVYSVCLQQDRAYQCAVEVTVSANTKEDEEILAMDKALDLAKDLDDDAWKATGMCSKTTVVGCQKAPSPHRVVRKLTLDYWWDCEDFEEEKPPQLVYLVHEYLMPYTSKMVSLGSNCGMFVTSINVDIPGRVMPIDGWECKGWWELK